jgi:hypothetical protein
MTRLQASLSCLPKAPRIRGSAMPVAADRSLLLVHLFVCSFKKTSLQHCLTREPTSLLRTALTRPVARSDSAVTAGLSNINSLGSQCPEPASIRGLRPSSHNILQPTSASFHNQLTTFWYSFLDGISRSRTVNAILVDTSPICAGRNGPPFFLALSRSMRNCPQGTTSPMTISLFA